MSRQLRIKRPTAIPEEVSAAARQMRMYERGKAEGFEEGKQIGIVEGVELERRQQLTMRGRDNITPTTMSYSRRLNFAIDRNLCEFSILINASIRVNTNRGGTRAMEVSMRVPEEMLVDASANFGDNRILHMYVSFLRELSLLYPLYLCIEEFVMFMHGVRTSANPQHAPPIFDSPESCIESLYEILNIPSDTYVQLRME